MAVVFPEQRVLALRRRDPSTVIGAFPRVQIVDGQQFGVSGPIVGVPHRNDSIQILRNLGVDTAGLEPIRSYYEYPPLRGEFAPMEHQETTAEFFTVNKRLFCLNEQRTGKTSAAIWASDFLMREKDVKAVLIICTMSCLRTVWENEVFSIVPGRSVAILHGTIERRRKLLAQNYNYFVINHDGIKVLLSEILAAIASGRIDLVILDEMAEFSDSKTDKYEAMEAIAYAAPRFWGLSATPMSKGPSAVWAQARLVDKNNVPKFFSHWRLDVETQVTKYKWVPKQDAKEKVYAALQPAIRFKKRDVLKNLPPLTHTRLEAELTAEQTKMIRELRKQGAMLLGSTRLTVANAAVMVNKALQICAGAVRLDDGTVHRIDCRPRLAEMLRTINGTDQKFVVLANHHAEVDFLQEMLSPKYNTAWVDGRRTGAAREKAFLGFMNDPNCRGLIAHPKTVSHGLEFSIADTLIWWSPCHSAELVAQANERMASAAQKHPMGVYQLGGHMVEWNVYTSSGNKLAYQASTLEQFKSFVND